MTTDHLADEPGLWIRRFGPPSPTAPRLVCFPHATGSATYYRPLALALAPQVEVVAFQYPGRQDRRAEPAIDDIHTLAERLYATGAAGWTDRPYALFGHSMGAVLAYEVACRLAERGAPGPVRLFVSGRRAPTTRRDERVSLRDDAGIVAELRRLGGTDSRLFDDPDLVAMILPAARADYRAIESYRPRSAAPVPYPVTVLTGDTDPNTTIEEAEAWRDCTAGPLDLHVFTGGHFFLDAHQDAVLRLVTGALSAGSHP